MFILKVLEWKINLNLKYVTKRLAWLLKDFTPLSGKFLCDYLKFKYRTYMTVRIRTKYFVVA